jgi:hypothetical protein
MREIVLRHLDQVLRAHLQLAELLPEEAFGRDLGTRSNSMGAQYWCVIGGRESYARALPARAWEGFACSLSAAEAKDKASVIIALERTGSELSTLLDGLEWDGDRERLLLALLEHETMHQGQLIRYVYGLGYEFPRSWKKRWDLE